MMAKKMKKLFALVLALSMTMSLLSVTAFAEGEGDGHPHNQVTCTDCDGTGHVLEDCEICGGTGSVTEEGPCTYRYCNGGIVNDYESCPVCNGVGTVGEEPCPNEDCFSGNIFITKPCPVCNGTSVVEKTVSCEACGNGKVETEDLCPVCGGTKLVDCAGSFDEGRLFKVNQETGEGTMRYSCAVCGAAYDEPLSAADTAQLLAEGLEVTFTVDSAKANEGAKLTYMLKIKNTNPVNVSNLTAQILLDENLVFTYKKGSNPKIGGNYKGSPAPTYQDAVAEYNEAGGMVDLTIPGIVSGKYLEVQFTAMVKDGVALGADLTTAFSGGMKIGGTGDTLALTSLNAGTHINKYQTASLYLCGSKMGGWYNPGDKRNSAAVTSLKNPSASLDDYEGATLSFDDAFNKDINPATGVISYSQNTEWYGKEVNNRYDSRTWQCVGFVPYGEGYGYTSDLNELSRFIYIDTNENDPAFQVGTLEDAQKAVADAGGILYGGVMDETFIQEWLVPKISDGSVSLMCVWYVVPEKPLEMGDYDDLSITPVNPVNYQATSGGVTVSLGEITREKLGHYDVELIVTIGSGAPDEINVNLSEALAAAVKSIVEEYSGNNEIEPGDSIRYHITLANDSGKNYQYRGGSVALGTKNFGGEPTLGTGFEGYPISEGIEVERDGKTVLLGIIPRRILNDPLKFLGVTNNGSDEAIGALLKDRGYGKDEDLTNTEITQKYLGRFYLDYLNKYVKEGEPKLTSFQDLTSWQMQILTDGDSSGVTETCREVAEAFYYFLNGRAWTFNGLSLYDQMKDNSRLNSDFSAAITAGTPFVLYTSLDGFSTANAFQNTTSGVGMQFKMYVPTDGGTGGTPPTNDPGTEIPDPDVPTGELPDTPAEPEQPVDIDDPEVPLGEAPKTGDLLDLWLALAGMSGIGLAGIHFTGRKKKREN